MQATASVDGPTSPGQALVPSVKIRVVELDGAVVDVAERWFGFSRAGVDVTYTELDLGHLDELR